MGFPKTCRGFPNSHINNIKAKCLRFRGMQQGLAPLHTTKCQAFSFNIVSISAAESPAIFWGILSTKNVLKISFYKLQIKATQKEYIVFKNVWYQNNC